MTEIYPPIERGISSIDSSIHGCVYSFNSLHFISFLNSVCISLDILQCVLESYEI